VAPGALAVVAGREAVDADSRSSMHDYPLVSKLTGGMPAYPQKSSSGVETPRLTRSRNVAFATPWCRCDCESQLKMEIPISKEESR
jgi:hypothetical protein